MTIFIFIITKQLLLLLYASFFFSFVHNDVGHITTKIFVFITPKAILFLCQNKYHAGWENTELYCV